MPLVNTTCGERCRSTSSTITVSATTGGGNRLLTPAEPAVRPANENTRVERRERLGGLLNFYYRRAA